MFQPFVIRGRAVYRSARFVKPCSTHSPFATIERPVVIETAIPGFVLASFCISVSPGPSWLFVISSTVSQGRKFGFAAVAGNGTGILCHTVATALGLAQLARHSSAGFTVLKFVGAAYLIYLGIRLFRQTGFLSEKQLSTRRTSLLQTLRDGCMVNLLNPKVPVLMLALMPQFIQPQTGKIGQQILILGCIHLLVASTILLSLVLICEVSFARLQSSERGQRRVQTLAASIMVLLGLNLLWT